MACPALRHNETPQNMVCTLIDVFLFLYRLIKIASPAMKLSRLSASSDSSLPLNHRQKKSVMKHVLKAISAAALVFIISNPIVSLANGGKNDKAKLTDEQVTVQYVGINEEHVVFH